MGKLRGLCHFRSKFPSLIAPGGDSMGDCTGDGMGGASLGCPLVEEAAKAEAEKECVVSA